MTDLKHIADAIPGGYISTSEAARIASCTQTHIGRICRSGEVECVRIGREWFVAKTSLELHLSTLASRKEARAEELRQERQREYREALGQKIPPANVVEIKTEQKPKAVRPPAFSKSVGLAALALLIAGSAVGFGISGTINPNSSAHSLAAVSASDAGNNFAGTVNAIADFISQSVLKLFGVHSPEKTAVVKTSAPTTPAQPKTNTATTVAAALLSKPTVIQQTIAPRNVTEQVTKYVTLSGVSESFLTDRLNQLENKLKSTFYQTVGSPSAYVPLPPSSGGFANNVALLSNIDHLDGVVLNNPTIIGGSISGTSGIGSGSLTGSGGTNTLAIWNGSSLSGTTTPTVDFINATSTATSTFTGGISVSSLSIANLSGCDTIDTDVNGQLTCGTDQTGSGAGTPGGANNEVQFNNNGNFGGDAGFTYSSSTDLVTVTNASTTRLTATYASSTQGFFGSLNIGSLSGILKATAGAISTALVNLATDITGVLPVANGGTGWANIFAGAIPYGNGTNALSTTTAGTNGQVLALLNGIPTWTATTTLATISGTLAVNQGGTGQSSFGQGILAINDSGAFVSTTSPTVNYITATSTTATSTFGADIIVSRNAKIIGEVTSIGNNAGFRVASLIGDDTNTAPWYGLGLSNVTSLSTANNQNAVQVGGYYGINLVTNFGQAGLSQAGNFGVGTTTPGTLLSLGSTGANTINLDINATSTFGHAVRATCFSVDGTTCISGGSGGSSIGESFALVNGALAPTTTVGIIVSASSTFAGNVTITGNSTTTNATTTNLAVSNQLTVGSLSGFLKATAGKIATATIDLVNDVGTSILAVANGGTGWANLQANTVLLGNGTGRIATTSAGTNGQTLALVGGIPTWVATTTAGTGITYTGTAFNNAGLLSLTQTFGTAQTGAITFATSSATTFNGLTIANAITNSGAAFTFAPDTITGTLNVAGGGTGLSSAADGRLLIGGQTATALSALATSTGGTILQTDFLTGRPSWVATSTLKIALSDTTGTLSVAKGGTNATSFSAGQPVVADTAGTTLVSSSTLAVNIGGTGATSFTANGLLYGNGTSAIQVTGQGGANTILTANAGAPSFSASPTIGTSVTVPLLISSSDLTLRSAAGAFSTIFQYNNGTEGARLYQNGNFGIGTSTPRYQLTIASSTGAQLALTDGSSTSNPWTFRSINGNLYIATSSTATFATSSVSVLVIDTNGNVGVGTSSPSSRFSINGVANFSTASTTFSSTGGIDLKSGGCFAIAGICVGGSSFSNTIANGGTATTTFYNGGVVFYNSTLGTLSQATSSAGLSYDNVNGRLGIGTASPTYALELLAPGAANSLRVGNSQSNMDFGGNGTRGFINVPSWDFSLQTGGNDRLYIKNNGLIGIGTTTPSGMFAISTSSGSEAKGLVIQNTSTGGESIELQSSTGATGGKFLWDNNNANAWVYSGATSKLTLGTGGQNARLTIDSSGNVGIGTTTVSGSRLTTIGSSADANLALTANSNGKYWAFDTIATGGRLRVASGVSGEVFTILEGGNVGIGTTTPVSQLSISSNLSNGTINVLQRFSGQTMSSVVSGSAILSQFETTGATWGAIGGYANGIGPGIGIWKAPGTGSNVTGAPDFYLSSAGNVGIGTTTPWRNLSVFGTVANPQQVIAYDNTRYATFQTDSVGDLAIEAQGQDIRMNDDNLWLCASGSCPTGNPSGTGSLIAETSIGVASSTPWAGLSLASGKAIIVAENTLATSTSMTVDWRNGNQQLVRIGTSATTITFTGFVEGQKLVLSVCNPATGSGGAITWGSQILWPGGTAPTQTTTATKCDIWSFLATNATSSLKIFGSQNANF